MNKPTFRGLLTVFLCTAAAGALAGGEVLAGSAAANPRPVHAAATRPRTSPPTTQPLATQPVVRSHKNALALPADIRALAREERLKYLARWDTNHDGRIEPAEREAIFRQFQKDAQQARHEWDLQRYDANHNGKLDPPELAAMRKDQNQWTHLAEQQRLQWLAKWDTNHDGQLDAQELQRLYRHQCAWVEQYRDQYQLRCYDLNHDGKLDAHERALMKADQARSLREVQDVRRKWVQQHGGAAGARQTGGERTQP